MISDDLNGRTGAVSICTLALGMAGILCSVPASAQWAVSEIGPSAPMHIQTQINTLAQQIGAAGEYVETAYRWKAQWDHYQRQIAQFMNTVSSPLLRNAMTFDPAPIDRGVAERCGDTSAFNLTELARMTLPKFEEDIRDSQKKICTQIVMLENVKYNAVVNYVQEVAPKLKSDLQEINRQRKSNNDPGTLAAIVEASARLAAQQTQSKEELDRQTQGADVLISSLTTMQRELARQAMEGRKKNAILKTVIRTAALEAALK